MSGNNFSRNDALNTVLEINEIFSYDLKMKQV